MTSEPVAWLNGSYLPLSRAALSVQDAGVTGGVTVTERLRTFRHVPFLIDEHLDRLVASSQAAYIPLPLPIASIKQLVLDIVARNAARIDQAEDLSVSVFVTAGMAGVSSLCAYATPVSAAVYAPFYDTGLRLVTPATHAILSDSLSPQIKSRSRLHWHIANAQADRFDQGATALLLDRDGFVTETATGNIFVVASDGTSVLTPRRSRTLHGISQQYVFGLLPGIDEADLHLEDVMEAREIFVTSSISCLLPVTTLNRTSIGDGQPGPVYRRLLAAWSAEVGVEIADQMRWMASGGLPPSETDETTSV